MKKILSHRFTYLISFMIVAAFLGFAYYLEIVQGILPCPLCMLQRICLFILGFIFLLGAIFKFKKLGLFFVGFSAFFMSTAGAFLAGRQAWLQHNPSLSSSNCDVSFQYMIKALPFDQVLKKIFEGGTECAQVSWKFLSFSLAEWSFICFLFFLIFSVWQLVRKKY